MILTDAQWAKMEPHCLGKKSDPGRTGGDGRLFLEAVLWVARTGAPWRDLPEDFGNWNAIFKRFRHWVNRDVFKQIFAAVSDDPDMEFAMIDGTIVKVHSPRAGRKRGTHSQAIGASRGGVTTKIVALTDALRNLVSFELLPGQRHDTIGVASLIDTTTFGGLIADKAFDVNWIVEELDRRGSEIVVSQHPEPTRASQNRCRSLQMAAPDRELLRKAQGVQTHRNARLKVGQQFLRNDLRMCRRDKLPINLDRP